MVHCATRAGSSASMSTHRRLPHSLLTGWLSRSENEFFRSFRNGFQQKWMLGCHTTRAHRWPRAGRSLRSMMRPEFPAIASWSKLASTWEGIKAGEILEKEGIHCNLTLMFGLHRATACTEAGITLISPFVGRILDWYKKDTGRDYPPQEDPGVFSVNTIYNYYKKFGYRTEVMGGSFGSVGEIIELAGCDLLTISPILLAELDRMQGDLPRKLDPGKAKDIRRMPMDRETVERMHTVDRMANEKLAEGITGFSKALVSLETMLAHRITELEEQPKSAMA